MAQDAQSTYGDVGDYYKNYYQRMMGSQSTGLMSKLAKYPHRVMERNANSYQVDILELGAGSLEHLSHVNQQFKTYFATDIDRERLLSSQSHDSRLERLVADAHALPFNDKIFDRVIAT